MTSLVFFVLAVTVKVGVIVGLLLLLVAWMPWVERKILGRIQLRRGPSHTGTFGLLQPIADGIKILAKEDITPRNAFKPIYLLAPAIVGATAIFSFSVIPFGDWTIHLSDLHPELHEFPLGYITDLDMAVLFVLAMSSMAVYGVAWGGWAGGSKYGLLGGLRASAQMISYELSVGLVLLGIVMLSGSLSLVEIVELQANRGWNLLYQPVGMVLFIVTMFAETNRLPFDLPEAETELVGGYHTEYSSMRFGLFFLGEYLHMITISALCTILFLGGWLPPFSNLAFWGMLRDLPVLGSLVPVFWFLLKTFFFLFLFIWVRGTFPRFRYDQLMKIGWKVLLEMAFVNLFLAALMRGYWPSTDATGLIGPWFFIQMGFFLVFLILMFAWPTNQRPGKTVRLED